MCEVTLGLFALQIHDWSIAELITRPEYRLLVASCQKFSVSLLKFILSLILLRIYVMSMSRRYYSFLFVTHNG